MSKVDKKKWHNEWIDLKKIEFKNQFNVKLKKKFKSYLKYFLCYSKKWFYKNNNLWFIYIEALNTYIKNGVNMINYFNDIAILNQTLKFQLSN